jgi:hypothetical protein
MVRGYLLVILFATLHEARLTRQDVREPTKSGQIYCVLSHSIFAHFYPLSAERISLLAGGTWSSLCLVNTMYNRQQSRDVVRPTLG